LQLFIQNKPVRIVRKKGLRKLRPDFDLEVNGVDEQIRPDTWFGDVLAWHPSVDQIFNLLQLLKAQKFKRIDSITIVVSDPKSASNYLKKRFAVVKAAGGLVEKDGKMLLIRRLDKWDLPKGKLEKGERPLEGAKREVEEECNIKVKALEKIGSTWHTYMRNGKHTLKKTYWYRMVCIDDRDLKPQVEEFITEVRWMTEPEWREALYNSYPTIRQVFKKYALGRKKVGV
jgi:8-oxo-dGTP pyrophosphatase MutT (NUDIX family)